MDYKNTIEMIIYEISEIEDLVSGFLKQEKIPQIEIGIALEKLRKIYDTLSMLEKSNLSSGKAKPEEKEASEPEAETTTEEASYNEEMGDEEEQPEEIINEEKSIPEPEILSDKYKGDKKYRDEILSESMTGSDLSSVHQSKPIDDLNSAIGINEKFLFINELFNGDSGLYKKVIERLNNSINFNDAFDYLNENFEWDMEDEHVQKILELVRRKFITHSNE